MTAKKPAPLPAPWFSRSCFIAFLSARRFETVSGEDIKVFHGIRALENHFGFLAIHASRNYGADSPLWGLCGRYPVLTFGGTFHNDTAPEMHWTFEGRNGELADDFEERPMTADELKALIEKRAAKIETLQEELTHLKHYLVRHPPGPDWRCVDSGGSHGNRRAH